MAKEAEWGLHKEYPRKDSVISQISIQELRRLIELGMVRVRMDQFWDTKHWDMEHVGDLYFLDEKSNWFESRI
ncbi:MAG: hypothetical protein GTN74_05260 [Proteobacteria bacterium]|nr:hypothetical protein [Pseudomonadota bacterium]NIS68898.1 hypothetical protein [Pseudomonadota bacterium]